MELTALETESLFSCAQCSKVFSRLWNNVVVKFEGHSHGIFGANLEIKIHSMSLHLKNIQNL